MHLPHAFEAISLSLSLPLPLSACNGFDFHILLLETHTRLHQQHHIVVPLTCPRPATARRRLTHSLLASPSPESVVCLVRLLRPTSSSLIGRLLMLLLPVKEETATAAAQLTSHHWKVRLLPLLSKKFFAHIPSPELVHRRLGRLLLRTEELFNQSVFPSLCWNRCCSYHHNKQVKSEIKCDHSRPLKIYDNC